MKPPSPLRQAQSSQDARSSRRGAILSVGLRRNLVLPDLASGPSSDLPRRTRKASLEAARAIERKLGE
jgi:hypothetical protein